MVYKDGGKFTTYCDKPYDSCWYTVHMMGGKEYTFSSYDEMRNFWFSACHTGLLLNVSIHDAAK